MKKVLVILAILAVVGGCASMQSWLCSNRDTIQQYVDQAQQTITTITAQYRDVIPVQYQAVIAAALVVVENGQNFLNEYPCPTDTQVQAIQDDAVKVNKASLKAGAGMMLKIK